MFFDSEIPVILKPLRPRHEYRPRSGRKPIAPAGKPGAEDDEPGSLAITEFPNAHGDHFHLGEAVVAARDATGLYNPAVFAALERKGLVRPKFPEAVILTPAGQQYDTGLRDSILHRGAAH